MKNNSTRKIIYILVIFSIAFLNLNFFPLKLEAVSLQQNYSNEEKALGQEMMAKASKVLLPFVSNQGQFDREVKYSAPFFAGNFFVTANSLVYDFRSADLESGKNFAMKEYFLDQDGRAIIFNLAPKDKAETAVSYFKGDDSSKWQSGLASYNTISLGYLYKNVEIKLKISDKNIEKVFYVNPGGLVSEILSKIRGVESLDLAENGELILKTTLGEFQQTKPIAYQEIGGVRKNVEVDYELRDANIYGFKVGDYNKKYPLIIDPELSTLSASTFLGGASADMAFYRSLVLDSSNNVYVTGYTDSAAFPTTVGAYDTTQNGGSDVFVSKFDSTLTSLLASTFIGGAGTDYGETNILIDGSGNIFLAGRAGAGFPTTVGAYDTTHNGGASDVFVAKLNSSLTTLSASTFLGGASLDYGSAISFDSSGNIFVVGRTASAGFPTTGGAYDTTHNGGYDAFVSKFNSSLSALSASTFIGTAGSDSLTSIEVDGSGTVYAGGSTDRNTFPITVGAYDTSYNGGGDGVIVEFNNALSSLSVSTFLGGAASDQVTSLMLDGSSNVVVVGQTLSNGFPTTVGAYDTSYNGGGAPGDMFVSKLNNALSSLTASTFLGGSSVDLYYGGLDIDSTNNIYVTGSTNSADYPTTPGAYDTTISGYDAFVSKLNSNLTTLSASTFIGGGTSDYGHALFLDSSSNIYVAGRTTAVSTFPTTPGAYDTTANGGDDAVVFYFLGPAPLDPYIKDTLSRLKISTPANHTVEFRLGSTVDWDAGDTVTLTFESDFDLSALASTDATDFDINTGTEETVIDSGTACGASDAIKITSIAGQIITFQSCPSYTPPGSNSTVTIEIGTNATTGGTGDSQITNPTVSGDYDVDFAGSIGDSNACSVGIVDDDQVIVTATVDPLFTFIISSSTCDLGTLDVGTVSTCNYTLAVGTNAAAGAIITIRALSDGTNTNLNNDANPSQEIDNIAENSTVTAGTEGYGIALVAGTGWSESGDFNDDDTPVPGSLTQILSAPGPITSTYTSTVTHRASISATTPAGGYTQDVEYIATGTF